ncbi:hypothetical protein HPB51_010007 [Rhipicephalus microplus]|uniref:Uncharacterized protein n=1 Tax=Rhipicephalus microplus TaxID=6941 RepID=A0A9J6ETD5_RHIMP|nr:hypothetical protein HPB51_010007 [Rhipicephalus microplus]
MNPQVLPPVHREFHCSFKLESDTRRTRHAGLDQARSTWPVFRQASFRRLLFAPSPREDHGVGSAAGFCSSARSTQGHPPSSDDFESDCPENVLSKGKTLLSDDGDAAVHRVGHPPFSLKSSSSEVHLDAGTQKAWYCLQNRHAVVYLDQLPVASRKEGRRVLEGPLVLHGDDAGGEVSEP